MQTEEGNRKGASRAFLLRTTRPRGEESQGRAKEAASFLDSLPTTFMGRSRSTLSRKGCAGPWTCTRPPVEPQPGAPAPFTAQGPQATGPPFAGAHVSPSPPKRASATTPSPKRGRGRHPNGSRAAPENQRGMPQVRPTKEGGRTWREGSKSDPSQARRLVRHGGGPGVRGPHPSTRTFLVPSRLQKQAL